jgi:para-aminobenzoate synthetase component I
MLNWSNQFSILLFLDSNDYDSPYSNYECLLGVNALFTVGNDSDPLSEIQQWHHEYKDWLLGHLCYDYKNALEPKLKSSRRAQFAFPLVQFFCPEIVCYITPDKASLVIEAHNADPDEVFTQITNTAATIERKTPTLSFQKKIGREQYLITIERLRQHIRDGDCYEINYCNEGFTERANINPLAAFNKLNQLSPAPFAAYYRCGDQYLLCASPERYLRKKGSTILSQPIKGTAKRDADIARDESNKQLLQESRKERAENVMIVDLVRNDLARSCETGSVNVDELFGIYSFPQVHQMISTVSGTLNPSCPFTDALKRSFPMGSMTGAPKHKVMELIDQYEASRRELFSGSVGYINPGRDFDFNVVIRSLFYNGLSRYLSYQTGGAITYDSIPEEEWNEAQLKAWALERVFS